MKDIPKDIIERAQRADMQAFEQLYQETCGFVYNVVLRIINNASYAQDVTQEVFIRIYKNLKKFQFRSSLNTWIYRIAVNSAINAYRKISRERNRWADFDLALKTENASPGPAEEIEKKDKETFLKSLLNILNPQQRACVVLREVEGLSYEEIAKTLKININTVRSRLKRARLKLLNWSKKEGARNEV